MAGKYMGFDALVDVISKRGGKGKGKKVRNPAAVAAMIGRKKYGKEKFQKAAASGKKMRGM